MRNSVKKMLMSSKGNTYIKKGLQLWLDGIDNTRNGHSSSTLITWEDLSDNRYDFNILGGTALKPENNCVTFDGTAVYMCANETLQDLMILGKKRTIEIVCSIFDDNTNAKTIFLGGKSNGLFSGAGMWYRPASKGMCISGNSSAHVISDITNPHTYSAVYDESSVNTAEVYQDNIKSNTTSGGTMANTIVTIGGRYYSGTHSTYRFYGKIYCIRVYDRQLTQGEREHNRKIDKERFGI